MTRALAACLFAVLGSAAAGCGDSLPSERITLSREELLKPETCADCHPRHYREWKSSMHAYAAADPVFLAMNRRGQEETNGELGDFCVRCHAPMAVIEGQTTDGLNFDEVDDHLEGVTCYFCHSVDRVEKDHNNGLVLTNGGKGGVTFFGGIQSPAQPKAHVAAYSPGMDGGNPESARQCGACHDIVTPKGVHLERTFAEWERSLFNGEHGSLTCIGCHMPGREGLLAAEDPDTRVKTRTVHEHLWPAVDVALTDWPDKVGQRKAVECELANGATLHSLEPTPEGEFHVLLETNAGHDQPSGASQDRRLWVEFIAYDEDDQIVFQTGKLGPREVVPKAEGEPGFDPFLQLFRSRIFDEAGKEVHMFWDAAPSEEYPAGFETRTFPPATVEDPAHHVAMTFKVPPPLPARVTVRALLQPMGADVLGDLIASGHLDEAVLDLMPTFELRGTAAEWRREDGFGLVPGPTGRAACDYRCEFDPEDRDCR